MHLKQEIVIRSPQNEKEYDAYYSLRWRILRAPWNRCQGSEKDELEENAVHRIATLNDTIIGCGRLHYLNEATAQIRYMAVARDFIKKGVGTKLLASLESAAKSHHYESILLHAREASMSFYEQKGYRLIKKSHVLFNEIQHYEMIKILT